MKRIDEINSRGFARGWHAEMLQKDAQRTGETMAVLFRRKIENSSGFNVPAEAVKVTSYYIYYTFLDGSTDRYRNPGRG